MISSLHSDGICSEADFVVTRVAQPDVIRIVVVVVELQSGVIGCIVGVVDVVGRGSLPVQ